MAPKKAKKHTKIKIKKKTWFKVLSPAVFGKREVGESYLASAEDAIGRVMKVNLRNLTGSMRDQNVELTLRINELKGSILHTEVVGYELVSVFVKRMVRKRTARIDNVFKFTTKDGKEVILKSLLVALHRNKRSTGVTLQNSLKDILVEELAQHTFADLVGKLASNKIQYSIKKKLTPIFPIKEFAVRSIKVADLGRGAAVTVVDESEAVKVEEAPAREDVAKEAVVEAVKEEETPAEETSKEAATEAE